VAVQELSLITGFKWGGEKEILLLTSGNSSFLEDLVVNSERFFFNKTQG